MLSIPGYQITEVLHTSALTLVYRAYREQDQCSVILKTLANEYPARKDLDRLQHEYALTQNWSGFALAQDLKYGLVRAHDLVQHQNKLVLILEDIGGTSIRQLLDGQTMPVDEFLPFAIAFAKNLHQIHQQHIIHKDINPANLVLNRTTGQVQIIDFGIASQLSRETTSLQTPAT